MREQKAKLEVELANLAAAVAEHGHSASLLGAIAQRESQLREITDRLLSAGKGSIEADLAETRRFMTAQFVRSTEAADQDVALAQADLGKHVSRITMKPDLERRHYTAIAE
jgi:hypothetical protein